MRKERGVKNREDGVRQETLINCFCFIIRSLNLILISTLKMIRHHVAKMIKDWSSKNRNKNSSFSENVNNSPLLAVV